MIDDKKEILKKVVEWWEFEKSQGTKANFKDAIEASITIIERSVKEEEKFRKQFDDIEETVTISKRRFDELRKAEKCK